MTRAAAERWLFWTMVVVLSALLFVVMVGHAGPGVD